MATRRPLDAAAHYELVWSANRRAVEFIRVTNLELKHYLFWYEMPDVPMGNQRDGYFNWLRYQWGLFE
jgi:hypothetical protein